jgi:hypothetical protein
MLYDGIVAGIITNEYAKIKSCTINNIWKKYTRTIPILIKASGIKPTTVDIILLVNGLRMIFIVSRILPSHRIYAFTIWVKYSDAIPVPSRIIITVTGLYVIPINVMIATRCTINSTIIAITYTVSIMFGHRQTIDINEIKDIDMAMQIVFLSTELINGEEMMSKRQKAKKLFELIPRVAFE